MRFLAFCKHFFQLPRTDSFRHGLAAWSQPKVFEFSPDLITAPGARGAKSLSFFCDRMVGF
jgi:hypothetical protein